MSAGICILNKNAIAMAADSAVTVGDHAAIHNSANKLFSLSRFAPVGAIVYANATLMTTPIEIIVKQYKMHLGDTVFPCLKDYVNDFLKYLEDNSHFFRFDINEKNYVFQIFIDLMSGMLGDYRNLLDSTQKTLGKPLDESELNKVAVSAAKATIDYIDHFSRRNDYRFSKYVEDHYLQEFIDCVKNDTNLQWLLPDQIIEVCKKACELYDTDFDRNCYVGVAIAGYGKDEIYPRLIHLHIGGIINSMLRYTQIESVEISEDLPASIAPLAQTDVMQTFLFGINDRFINDLAKEIPNQIRY